jgi:hypothetical protein
VGFLEGCKFFCRYLATWSGLIPGAFSGSKLIVRKRSSWGQANQVARLLWKVEVDFFLFNLNFGLRYLATWSGLIPGAFSGWGIGCAYLQMVIKVLVEGCKFFCRYLATWSGLIPEAFSRSDRKVLTEKCSNFKKLPATWLA